MAVHVRPCTENDLLWLVENDGHLDVRSLRAKVDAGEVFVADIDGEPVGLLRLDYLWSTVPFIALVRVVDRARRRGVGRELVAFVSDHVRARGADVLLSSATADEPNPQAWHRSVGFTECGHLEWLRPDEPGEVFFQLPL